jgi:hypothetical protein
MLTCVPLSLCSWDYEIRGARSGPATLTFNYFIEQGGIFTSEAEFSVRKHGPMSGHWTLESDREVLADAVKPSAMVRSFEVKSGDAHFDLTAHSVMTRSYDFVKNGSVVGTICPAHAFTRRAFIECGESIPEIAQIFAFWLVALTWRRAANNN